MSTQTAVEQKTTQYPPGKSGTDEPAGGTGGDGAATLPVPPGGAVQHLKSERVQEGLKAALRKEKKDA